MSRLRAPATLVYLAVLVATTAVLQTSDDRTDARLLQEQSTNLYHLARDPIRVLVASAFWVGSARELLIWAPLFLLLVAPAEARFGSRLVIGVFAVGHVGATLLVALGLWIGLRLDVVARSVVHARDVGASYGFFAAATLFTLLLPRWRPLYVAGLAAYPVTSVVLSHGFTDVGHLLALAIGLACAAVISTSAAASARTRRRARPSRRALRRLRPRRPGRAASRA